MAEANSPQSLAKEGKSAYQRGDYLAAARTFEAARSRYRATGDELNGAEMANNSSVAFLQGGEAEEALKAVDGTAESFAAADDLKRQGMAVGNQAAALEALERFEEALAAYQQSADILQQAGEDQLRANVMNSLSMLQFRMGKQLQAFATMHSGLEGVEKPSPKQRFLKKVLNIPIEMITKKKKS